MGSSRALLCSAAFVLVVLGSASTDEGIEQREVTFDLDKIMQEMQQSESLMMQKEVDLSDLLDPKEFPIDPVMASPPKQYDTPSESKPGVSTPIGRQPGFGPRSFGGHLMQLYPVQFPLAQPSSDNLQAICLHADHRPHYPDSYFPDSGFGFLKRRASAVNRAETWFSSCCQGNETWGSEVTLCCATQAWELSVKSFCKEEFSVKDRHDECCKQTGSDRLNCFHKKAPNQNYMPTEELPVPQRPPSAIFNFEPKTCQGTVKTQYNGRGGKKGKRPSTSQKVDINFPPGRPTADVIKSLCSNRKYRPLYNIKCLPASGYEWLAHQAKTINHIEKNFKHCCKKKKDMVNCADKRWREELNKFCMNENGEQIEFQCCSAGDESNDRFDCFQNMSRDPYYNMTSATTELSLNKVCETHKLLKKRFHVGFSLKTFVNECCPQSEEEKSTCVEQTLKDMSKKLCSSKKGSPTVRRCCRASSENIQQCFSKTLMDAVTKAAKILRQKEKKRCPLA